MSDAISDYIEGAIIGLLISVCFSIFAIEVYQRRIVRRLDALLSVEQARYLIESVERPRPAPAPASEAAPIPSPVVPPSTSRKAHSREGTAE